MSHLNVAEIFDSIQGEGPYIGTKQIFIRLAGCNLACSYCDTSWAWKTPEKFKITLGNFNDVYVNPIPAATLAEILTQYIPKNVYAVSITGGEPLEQAEALKSFLPALHSKTKILLETNGTLPEQLSLILPWVDIVSMDIKLPHYIGENLFNTHEEFLKLAQGKKLYVKTIVSGSEELDVLEHAAELVAAIDPEITFVIQPLVENEKQWFFPVEEFYKLQESLLKIHKDVRVIPQIHKLIGIK